MSWSAFSVVHKKLLLFSWSNAKRMTSHLSTTDNYPAPQLTGFHIEKRLGTGTYASVHKAISKVYLTRNFIWTISFHKFAYYQTLDPTKKCGNLNTLNLILYILVCKSRHVAKLLCICFTMKCALIKLFISFLRVFF